MKCGSWQRFMISYFARTAKFFSGPSQVCSVIRLGPEPEPMFGRIITGYCTLRKCAAEAATLRTICVWDTRTTAHIYTQIQIDEYGRQTQLATRSACWSHDKISGFLFHTKMPRKIGYLCGPCFLSSTRSNKQNTTTNTQYAEFYAFAKFSFSLSSLWPPLRHSLLPFVLQFRGLRRLLGISWRAFGMLKCPTNVRNSDRLAN